MKKSILCLLVILTLCLCVVFASCKKDDEVVAPPDSGNVGQKGETIIDTDLPGEVKLDSPNQTVEGSTPRY
jgi:hypothetical protein